MIVHTSLAIVTTFALLASASAGPERRRIIGILDVHLDGVPSEIAKQFQSNLEASLDSRAYWLAPQQRMKELLGNSTKWTEGCVIGTCLSEVKVQTGADIVLLASISGSGTSFGYVVTLLRTDTGRFVAQDANRCDVCTVKEALANATAAAVKLVTGLPDKLPDEEADRRAALQRMIATERSELTTARARHKAAGLALVVTGIIVAGAGLTAYLVKDHSAPGLATATAGAGLALGGVITLSF